MQDLGAGRSCYTMQVTLWVFLAVLAMVTLAAACDRGDDIPTLERRAQEINKVVMCPVCPGESIDQSQHELAVQMRSIVEDRLQIGWSEQQIKDFFVERYGPSVLLEPPRHGFDLLVWIVPPAGLGLAVVALYLVLRMMVGSKGRDGDVVSSTSALTEEERAIYLSRVASALALEDQKVDTTDDRLEDDT